MAAIEHEWARRIRAAAAYAGIEQQELARALGMSVTTLGRHLKADKRPHEIRALTQTVAEITGLPYAFFTIDFQQLERLQQLRNEVVHLQPATETDDSTDNLVLVVGHLHERLAAIEGELGLRDVARAENQALTAALDRAGAAGHPAVHRTRDEEGASEESDTAPARETPSSAEPPAR